MSTVTLDPEKFSIKTEQFEGPLELLIELVEKRKLLINDISLATVTDEYMARVSQMQEQSLPNTAQFITLAATLLLIKSKSLLPVLELSEDEESSIEDLEERLKRYQLYREAAVDINQQFGETLQFAPRYAIKQTPLFTPDDQCQLPILENALATVLTDLPKTSQTPKVTVRPAISLEDMITNLKQRIQREMTTRFSDIQKCESEHRNVIVGFLAILELVKQGDVLVIQAGRFSDIEVSLERQGTPQYY
jgi:segregation and condensation protein A